MQRPLVGYAADFPPGYELAEHSHPSSQLIYAASGVMTVATGQGRWVVPPQRAVWVPPSVTHSVRMSGKVRVRTLYLDPASLRDPPRACCVVNVSPLLRELILRVVEFTQPYPLDGPEARIAAVVVDEIRTARVAPLHLPTPRDPRLLPITGELARNPADRRTLAQWSRTCGASVRTLARLFERETRLSFAHWRQQARLLRALELLASEEAVTSVALDLGYESLSAFISMFRQSLGATPAKYFGHQHTEE
jgi:AraC-like DNA-binding protein